MLAGGGYPWTIVPLHERNEYMTALEQANVAQNIEPFADFLAALVSAGLEGKPVPELPPST